MPTRSAKRAQQPNVADMPRKSLALIAQRPELSHVGFAQRRPIPEQPRDAFVAAALCVLNLPVVECRKVPGKGFDHGRGHYDPPEPCGTPLGRRSSPNHFRIFVAKLRRTCMRASLPPLLAQWPERSRRKRG
jgi:hypothetical protein